MMDSTCDEDGKIHLLAQKKRLYLESREVIKGLERLRRYLYQLDRIPKNDMEYEVDTKCRLATEST